LALQLGHATLQFLRVVVLRAALRARALRGAALADLCALALHAFANFLATRLLGFALGLADLLQVLAQFLLHALLEFAPGFLDLAHGLRQGLLRLATRLLVGAARLGLDFLHFALGLRHAFLGFARAVLHLALRLGHAFLGFQHALLDLALRLRHGLGVFALNLVVALGVLATLSLLSGLLGVVLGRQAEVLLRGEAHLRRTVPVQEQPFGRLSELRPPDAQGALEGQGAGQHLGPGELEVLERIQGRRARQRGPSFSRLGRPRAGLAGPGWRGESGAVLERARTGMGIDGHGMQRRGAAAGPCQLEDVNPPVGRDHAREPALVRAGRVGRGLSTAAARSAGGA
jgi:hypothetical protein